MTPESLQGAVGPRFDAAKLLPDTYKAMYQLELAAQAAFERAGLDRSLYELVKLRASQINGCGFCIDMHTKDARRAGETEQRIYLLNAWAESPQYTPVERAALALAEAVTEVSEGQVPDQLWSAVSAVLNEEQRAAVVAAAVTINAWNRLAISSRTEVGSYQPR